MKLYLLFILLNICQGFNLCVVGGNSGLGREIIFQGISANKKILALSNSSNKIQYPYRGGGLDIKSTNTFIESNNLKVDTYNNFNKYQFENIVFTLGGQPFSNDYSDQVTNDIISNIDSKLNGIILVSAYGAGESLKNSNIGIKIMNNLYLQDTYRAKNSQEKIINEYSKENNINTFILRPKALSYG
ncbi:hypothetical protein ceV_364 [Chrysochromulina ericina virus CeV-01B]|uniref:NAD(P)-binding domain-containing protein n=1 Tax=Chrysochromulina ericina virus CeV-01B TaxID=3070830 RepID=A0A0N9QYW1_9VIRU|nr:hypothetical protein ceV_364 [Chrysochromulina ericina virus]ALH23270.1 hypothetical protein ceV_364 [Chrysochromulina ericina virus CeV-01B]|tara:strand:+ start:2284 stop:2844 length:561 start_codon:yes stop_codon:yes gene_type:complete